MKGEDRAFGPVFVVWNSAEGFGWLKQTGPMRQVKLRGYTTWTGCSFSVARRTTYAAVPAGRASNGGRSQGAVRLEIGWRAETTFHQALAGRVNTGKTHDPSKNQPRRCGKTQWQPHSQADFNKSLRLASALERAIVPRNWLSVAIYFLSPFI